MTWFSLPALRKDRPPAFVDMEGCNAWLSAQPLANAPLMQEMLASQLEMLNGWPLAPRERFKIVETLRKPVFAIETEAARRYEGRPLPLSPVEQKGFDASCRLWRQLATGYLHCLQACLDRDESLAEHRAKIAHRVLTCLRLEQLARYRAGATIPGSWWQLLHAAMAAAEQLAAAASPIADRLFAETRESTPGGQYAMALLLHLSRPYELSRSQFAAVLRWLARWREQAPLLADAEAARDVRTLAIDLTGDGPGHSGRGVPAHGRWLVLDAVLGKFKSRIKGLRDGQSPEELRLGSGLAPDACIGLLQFLHGALQSPPAPPPVAGEAAAEIRLATTLENIHLLLGGKPVNAPPPPTAQSNRTLHEQIAIFGHVVQSETPSVEGGWSPGSCCSIRMGCWSCVAHRGVPANAWAIVASLPCGWVAISGWRFFAASRCRKTAGCWPGPGCCRAVASHCRQPAASVQPTGSSFIRRCSCPPLRKPAGRPAFSCRQG